MEIAFRATLVVLSMVLAVGPLLGQSGDVYTDDERSHWSLQPRSLPSIPVFADSRDSVWLANPVDAFVLARL